LINIKLTVKTKISKTCKGDINGYRKGYHPGTDIVNDEKVNLVVDSDSVLAK
jgi:hypothetical protein